MIEFTMETITMNDCSCGCHNHKSNSICCSCDCDIDKFPKEYNTIILDNFCEEE